MTPSLRAALFLIFALSAQSLDSRLAHADVTKPDASAIASGRGFLCRDDAIAWDTAVLGEAISHARRYLAHAPARDQSGAQAGKRPLHDDKARAKLLARLNTRLGAAQLAAATMPARGGISVVSDEEIRLAQASEDFAGASPRLLEVLSLYRRLGFHADAQRLAQCARGQAAASLERVSNLANASRLYDSLQRGGAQVSGEGTLTRGWLNRQLARTRVLAGYASQYLAFLHNSREAEVDDLSRVSFWENSVNELERYLQFQEPNGQVAALHDLFLHVLPGDGEDCRKRLAEYQPPEYGNDLFSQVRRLRLEQALFACNDRLDAAARAIWRPLADRFNRELAGRYPFGPIEGRDAAPCAVKAFLADYAVQRSSLGDTFAARKEWAAARAFLARMDAVAAFFADNLSGEPGGSPLRIGVEFNLKPAASAGVDQIVRWTLSNGTTMAAMPNGANSLEWAWGQPLQFGLDWAGASPWRPLADASQSELAVEGTGAVFSGEGYWALLRLIQRHRVAPDPFAPGRIILAFDVPAASAVGQASRVRPHIGLTLGAINRCATTLPQFPAVAPLP